MSNGLRRDNHYIPQMILKNFTNENSKIYQFNKSKLNWNLPNGNTTDGQVTTAGVAKQRDIYIFEDINDNLNDSIEKEFSYIEGTADKIIKKILSYNYNSRFVNLKNILNNAEYNDLIEFLITGFVRTPKKINSFAKLSSEIAIKMLEDDVLYKNISDLIEIESNTLNVKTHNNIILHATLNEKTILSLGKVLINYEWVILDNNTRFNFLINDIFINSIYPGLSYPNNKLYIPISKNKILIGFNFQSHRNLEMTLNQIIVVQKSKLENIIKECNLVTILNSYEYIYSTYKDKSIENLIKKTAIVTETKNHYGNIFIKNKERKIIVNKK